MQANILPFYTPSTPGWGQKVKTIFSEEGHVAYQITKKEVNIMQVKCLTLCTPLTFWAG